jgi:hypothetical protein
VFIRIPFDHSNFNHYAKDKPFPQFFSSIAGVFRMFLNLVLAYAVRGEPSQGVTVEGAAGEDGCVD